MSGDMMPRPSRMRLSDADRERIAEGLQLAVGEGRLTLEEFEQRLTGVLAAHTFNEVQRFVADLPDIPMVAPAPEYAELRTTAARLDRRNQWVVPRRLLVTAKAGAVKLDFTEAIISHRIVEIELNVVAGSTTLVLPRGASANIDNVEVVAGNAKVRRVPTFPVVGSGPHFLVRGRQRAGQLLVRYQRRFWRWRW